jgi:ribosomal-protein-alanine N-acetyltransferase
MNHDDLKMVSDIERRSYEFPWSHGVFRDCLLAGYQSMVLIRDRCVVGYAILSVAAGEAHILNLCVDIDRPSNETAIALYRKKGFHQIAARPAYYQANEGREDAAVLAKKLVING